jgi:hypothetical protein
MENQSNEATKKPEFKPSGREEVVVLLGMNQSWNMA